jgi:hypothetical protein
MDDERGDPLHHLPLLLAHAVQDLGSFPGQLLNIEETTGMVRILLYITVTVEILEILK